MENENAVVDTVENQQTDDVNKEVTSSTDNQSADNDLAERLRKAEEKIVSLKKEVKQYKSAKEENSWETNEVKEEAQEIKEKVQEDTNENSTIKELQSQLEELQAKLNQNTSNSMWLWWTDRQSTSSQTQLTSAELEKMSTSEYEKVREWIIKWEIEIVD